MKKRHDFTVRFAGNGIIVQTYRQPGDYSRDAEKFEELVFNSVHDFERWFERHSDMNDDGSDLHEMTMGELAEETDYDLEQKVFIKPEWIRRAIVKGPVMMGIDPAAPRSDSTVITYHDAEDYLASPCDNIKSFEPKPADKNVIDALREAENVVKRFTGVKP